MMAEYEAVTEAIKKFSNGQISKDALEEIVAREEGQRYEADAAAVIVDPDAIASSARRLLLFEWR